MLSEVTESISSVHRIFILVSVYTVTVSMPLPLDTSTTRTDPNIIEGQWKRRPTERATENGDLLARKKARITTARGVVNLQNGRQLPNAFPLRMFQTYLILSIAHQSDS